MVPTIKDRKRIALCNIILAVCLCNEENVGKKKMCKDWLMKRRQLGSHVTSLRELQNGQKKDF